MKLIYNIKDRPKFGATLVFAIQQLLVILAALILDIALLTFLEKAVNRAGDIRHIYETQIVGK